MQPETAAKAAAQILDHVIHEISELTFGLEPFLAARWYSFKLADAPNNGGMGFSFLKSPQNPQFSEFPPEQGLLVELVLQSKLGVLKNDDAMAKFAYSAGAETLSRLTYKPEIERIRALGVDLQLLIRIFMGRVDLSAWTMVNPAQGELRTVYINQKTGMVAVRGRGMPEVVGDADPGLFDQTIDLPWVVGEVVLRYWLMIRPLQQYITELLEHIDLLPAMDPKLFEEVASEQELSAVFDQFLKAADPTATVTFEYWMDLRKDILFQTKRRDPVAEWERLLGFQKKYIFQELYVGKYGRETIVPFVGSTRY